MIPVDRQIKTDQVSMFENARMVNLAFQYVMNEGIAGDYHEFGVLSGRTYVEAWHAVRRFGLDARLHAYDSFAGLPEVRGVDTDGPFHTGQFCAARTAFEQCLLSNSVPSGRVTLTEGFFDQTLPSAPRHPAAVVFIDCDLYESPAPVLDYLTDVLVDGAVVMFDDWFCFRGRADRGQQRACGEWLESNPRISMVPYRDFHWGGKSFLVNRLHDQPL
jgi:O-methyltransferase